MTKKVSPPIPPEEFVDQDLARLMLGLAIAVDGGRRFIDAREEGPEPEEDPQGSYPWTHWCIRQEMEAIIYMLRVVHDRVRDGDDRMSSWVDAVGVSDADCTGAIHCAWSQLIDPEQKGFAIDDEYQIKF